MTINILYFAKLREDLGRSGEAVELPREVTTVASLRAWLGGRGEPWARAIGDRAVRVAVNQEMVRETVALKDGDEVAFFPPVTGG
jgi:molybdopterin synthase sulfur carrier subunit